MAIIRDRIQKQIEVVSLGMNDNQNQNDNQNLNQNQNENQNQVFITDLSPSAMGEQGEISKWKVLWLARARDYEMLYLKNYVGRSLRRQMLSIYLLQLASFNESKFEAKYLLPLTSLVRRVYTAPGDASQQKEVSFNFVNLKYPYHNSSLFSSILVAKIKNRKTKLLTVLRASLAMWKVGRLSAEARATLYKEIYNRERRLPNIKVDENSQFERVPALMDNAIHLQYDTTVERGMRNSRVKGNHLTTLAEASCRADSTSRALVNTTLKALKNKAVSGIRLEVAGRLTRRYTAARSLFKLRYKGNLKNMDSSQKGLSAVLLRGHAKSNLTYTKTCSRVRIGSFGVKGWVSSS